MKYRVWLHALIAMCLAAPLQAQTAPAVPPEAPATQPATQPETQPATATAPALPGALPGAEAAKPDLVSLAFRDVPVEQIFTFISEKTGKPVIPNDSVKQKKVTIIFTKQLPLAEAMLIIREALRQNGIVLEESPRLITMKSIAEARQSTLPVIGEDEDVATLEDKSRLVHKVFVLRHYDVMKMKDVVLPMLPDYGHVLADPNAGKLVVTDTVGSLERIAKVIASMDVPQAEQTIKKIIPVKHGDAADIVSIVRVMIASSLGSRAQEVVSTMGAPAGRGSAAPSPPSPGPGRGGPSAPPPAGGAMGKAVAVFVEENKSPVVLLPEVSRNWIIAVASAPVMAQIEEWVARLDTPAATDQPYEIFEIEHADIDEVTRQVGAAIDSMPGDLRQSIRIVPLPRANKILVTGSVRGRTVVRELLARLDVESSGTQATKVFELQYADAEQVAKSINEIFGQGSTGRDSYRPYYWYDSMRGTADTARIKVASDTRRNTVTVVGDAAKIAAIEKMLLEQWDKPLTQEDVQPKIYVLKHADALRVKDLLMDMFSRRTQRFSLNWFSGMGQVDDTAAVGRLFGQFSFQTMPDSNRLVVITKTAANYAVIDRLVEQLDQPQEAGLPMMVELKHANAEDLAEQLNATLAEEGTLAEILRSKRELDYAGRSAGVAATARGGEGAAASSGAAQQQQQRQTAPGTMAFWWQRAQRRTDQKPMSNLIGKIRFVPINRRNALLVVAPQAYLEPIRGVIEDLDQPGMQVIVHAVIAEIEHNDATTVGMRIASDPSLLRDPRLADGSIGAGVNFQANEIFGGAFAVGGNTFARQLLQSNVNVSVLVQLLLRNFNAKILFEPKLYTADNQEAEFFDGQDVPYQTNSQRSAEGTTIFTGISYAAVGTRLRIRPHITKDGDVDLTINLELSRIVAGPGTLGNPIFDRRETTTHVVVHDGQTVMLSGIVRQEDTRDVRKIPFLGSLPLVGAAFRSTDKFKGNRELVAFITPRVIKREDEPAMSQSYKEWLLRVRKEIEPPKATDKAEVIEPSPAPTDGEMP